jgi:hypothetical protein
MVLYRKVDGALWRSEMVLYEEVNGTVLYGEVELFCIEK